MHKLSTERKKHFPKKNRKMRCYISGRTDGQKNVFSLDFRQCDCHFQISFLSTSMPSTVSSSFFFILLLLPFICVCVSAHFRFHFFFLSVCVCAVSLSVQHNFRDVSFWFLPKQSKITWITLSMRCKEKKRSKRHNLGFVIFFFFSNYMSLRAKKSGNNGINENDATCTYRATISISFFFTVESTLPFKIHITITIKVDTLTYTHTQANSKQQDVQYYDNISFAYTALHKHIPNTVRHKKKRMRK